MHIIMIANHVHNRVEVVLLDQLEELLDPRLQHLVVRGHVQSIKTDIVLISAQMVRW